jgi:hypothetical protein
MRPTKIIKLSNCEVEVITFLNWGEKETLQAELLKGAKVSQNGLDAFDISTMLNAKYKLFEVAIKGIKEGEVKKQYSKDWIDNLSIDDGDLLYNELEQLNKKKI